MRQRLAQSLAAFATLGRNRAMRNLQLAGAGSALGIWAYSVAVAVYAYRADGATAVGLLYFVRWTIAAAFVPWLALLADRFPRRRVMLASDLTRVCLVGGMAAAAALDAPSLVVYALAVVTSVVAAAFIPAQGALLPSLAATPDELTAANVTFSTVQSVGVFAGPALAGGLLAVGSPSFVFVVTAATHLWSASCVSRLPADTRPEREEAADSIVGALLGGFRAIGSTPGLRLLIGLTGAQTLVLGALQVLVVVVALQLLHAGDGGVGWLNAAMGVGGIAGGLVASLLVARLARAFAIGLVVFGGPLALIAISPRTAAAVLLFALIGVGSTVADVAGETLLQRAAADEVLARVFGVLSSLIYVTLAVGAGVTPLLVDHAGARPSLVAVGVLLPVILALTWRRLRAVDAAAPAPTGRLELLRTISIFAPLPEPVLERLAAGARELTVPAGETVVRQGDPGDLFYAIESGTAGVDVAGETGQERLGPGDFFGEIALLRELPRTATVRALEQLTLLVVERDAFLAAVTGHAPSRAAAEQVVAARLPATTPV